MERVNNRGGKSTKSVNQDVRKGIGKLLGIYLERVNTGCCRDSGRNIGIDDEQLGRHSSDLGEEGAARRRQVPFSLFLSRSCCPLADPPPLLSIERPRSTDFRLHIPSYFFKKLCLLYVRFTWIMHGSVISIVERGRAKSLFPLSYTSFLASYFSS